MVGPLIPNSLIKTIKTIGKIKQKVIRFRRLYYSKVWCQNR